MHVLGFAHTDIDGSSMERSLELAVESSVSYHSVQKALHDDGLLMSLFKAKP